RDKFAASRRKGMWMGGTIPLGYDVQERKLIVNKAEAETVQLIFQRYLVVYPGYGPTLIERESAASSGSLPPAACSTAAPSAAARSTICCATASTGARSCTKASPIRASTKQSWTKSSGMPFRPGSRATSRDADKSHSVEVGCRKTRHQKWPPETGSGND